MLFITQLYQAAYGLTPASMSGLGIGFLLVVCSNLDFVWGWPGIRQFGFSFGFLLVALPIPSLISAPIVDRLQAGIASLDVEVLNLIGIPSIRTGNLIAIASGTVGIDEACSGIRSLQATLMISLFLGQRYQFTAARRFGLILAGFGLAVFFNLVRTFALVCLASQSGLGALGKWHDLTGVTILVACFLGLWLSALALKIAENGPGGITGRIPRGKPGGITGRIPRGKPGGIAGRISRGKPGGIPSRFHGARPSEVVK
jgi:exosortase